MQTTPLSSGGKTPTMMSIPTSPPTQAWGHVGHEVTWDPEIEISHVHTDKCWELTCGKKEHTHTAECLKNCPHTHDLTCYGLNANASSVNPNDEAQSWNDSKPETYFEQLGLEDGYLYYDDENARLSWFDVRFILFKI